MSVIVSLLLSNEYSSNHGFALTETRNSCFPLTPGRPGKSMRTACVWPAPIVPSGAPAVHQMSVVSVTVTALSSGIGWLLMLPMLVTRSRNEISGSSGVQREAMT